MSEFFTGEIANAKVGRNIVNVEVIEDCGNGSYKVKSFATGREFYTHRLEHTNHPLNEELDMIEDEHNIIPEQEEENNAVNPAPESGKTEQKKKRSLFDAAVEVLKRSEEPLSTKEIVEKAIALDLWEPTGAKTPEQTLYSSIFRENSTKENPRIIKSELKGKFRYGG